MIWSCLYSDYVCFTSDSPHQILPVLHIPDLFIEDPGFKHWVLAGFMLLIFLAFFIMFFFYCISSMPFAKCWLCLWFVHSWFPFPFFLSFWSPTLAILVRPFANTFKLSEFQVIRYWAYLMTIIPETRRAQYIRYLLVYW